MDLVVLRTGRTYFVDLWGNDRFFKNHDIEFEERKKEWIWSDTTVWYIKPLLLSNQQWSKENQYDYSHPDIICMFYSISNKTISLFVKPTMQQYNQYDFSFSFLPTRRMLVLFLEDDKKKEIVSKKRRRTEEKYVWSTLSQLTFLDQINQTTFYRINHPITL